MNSSGMQRIFKWFLSWLVEYKLAAIVAMIVWAIMWILASLQSIPLFYRIPIILFAILCIFLILWSIVWVYYHFTNPVVLEIIYDNGKYNKRKNVRIEATYDLNRSIYNCFFYIVGVRNISKKTINSLSLITDGNKCIHGLSGEYTCDINPGSIELFDMCGESIEGQKRGIKITITATGKDIKPIIKTIVL